MGKVGRVTGEIGTTIIAQHFSKKTINLCFNEYSVTFKIECTTDLCHVTE